MREIFRTFFSSLRRFSFRGFLFRRSIKGKLLYILDLTLVVLTLITFCLVISFAVSGLVLCLFDLLF